MKKSALLSFILLLSFTTHAQINLDSLWGVWNDETAHDTSRALAMSKIAREGYLYSQPDSAYYFAQMMYDFAFSKGLKKEMAIALSTQGGSYYVKGDYTNAMDYYHRCLLISEEISDKKGMAKTLNNIGVIYSIQGDYPKALDYYRQSLRIKEEIADKSGIAGALNNIGLIFMNQGDYPKALDFYQRSLKINEDIADKRGIAQTLNNIGLIYNKLGNYSNALDCFGRVFNTCEEISHKSGMAGALNNIGLIYMNQNDYSNALDYYQRSLKIIEEVSDKRGMAQTLNNLGLIYMNQGDYPKALDYYQQSLNINEEISDKRGMSNTLTNIGRINNKQKQYSQAILWCKRGLQISEEFNVLDEQNYACQCLYDAYKAMGNGTKALEYHERIMMLNDSLQAEETSIKLQQMEFAKQILADSLLQEKEKLKIQIAHDTEIRKKNQTRNIFIISVLFLIIAAVGLYRRIVFVRRAKAAIEKEKDRSDKLLLNILPGEIAEELKEKGRADARRIENVSILFTDFKEFTQISEKLSAEDLVREINTCYEKFDAICEKYGIEKIKTIGDSYMAAGGLPVPSDGSVKNTVLAGLEMTEFMINKKKEREAEGNIPFEMRVGIHTGPVVAGIVGVTKFQYDIWGDTVNTAARMEHTGDISKVNISQSTYELIREDPTFKFQSRGKIEAKGKGDIEMWFVEKL